MAFEIVAASRAEQTKTTPWRHAVRTGLALGGVGVFAAVVGILTMFGVPAEGIAIVLGVDRILDMSRTTVNVWGDLTATAFVARSEGVWDASMVPQIEGMDRPAAA